MDTSLTPCSFGRRNCIGQDLAWEGLHLALSAIIHAGQKLRIGLEIYAWEFRMSIASILRQEGID